MTSKLVVNTIEADTGISSVSFASSISMSSTSKFHFSAAGVDIGADTNINRPAAGVLGFNINSSEKARIDSSGRVLIGTTTEGSSSADDLTVATSGTTGITIRSGTSNNGNIEFSDGTSGQDEYRGIVQYAHSDNSMRFYTNATEKLRIDSSGSVGIGTNNPTDILDINSDSASAVTNMYLRNHANLGGAALNIWTQGTYASPTYKAIIGCSDAGGNIRMGASSNHDLLLLTNNDAKVTIKSDGKVGINQTSPQRILHIGTSGTAEANIRIQGGSDYGEIRVKDSDNNLSFHHNVGGAGSRELFNSNGSTGHFSINCYTYQALTVTTNENGTNGPELSLFHNSASPAASDSIAQIRFNAKDSAGNTDLYARIHANLASPTSGSESGDLVFSTRGSGTFAERLRISSDGTTTFDPNAGGTLKVGGSSAHTSKIVIADNGGTGNGNCLVEGGDGTDFFTIQSNGNVNFASGKGITFADSSTSAVLDDYEEGSWTPAIAFDVGGSGIQYGTRGGTYVKIGRMVHLQYYMNVTGGVSSSDYFARLALPFTGIGVNHQDARIRQWNTSHSDWFVSLGGGNPVFFMSNAAGSSVNYARGDDVNNTRLSGQYTLYI